MTGLDKELQVVKVFVKDEFGVVDMCDTKLELNVV